MISTTKIAAKLLNDQAEAQKAKKPEYAQVLKEKAKAILENIPEPPKRGRRLVQTKLCFIDREMSTTDDSHTH